jgi:hypothetical protein
MVPAGPAVGAAATGPLGEEPQWTDRELFERLSESPAEREAREQRDAIIERRIARDRALDELIDPILERARAYDEAKREKRRAAYRKQKLEKNRKV